jgi:hypothetical protein
MSENDIPMPEISPGFTIDDIHKIREWNYERRKGMTVEQIYEDTRKGAESYFASIAAPADPAIMAEVERKLAAARKRRLAGR